MVADSPKNFNCQKCSSSYENWPDFHQHINGHYFETELNNLTLPLENSNGLAKIEKFTEKFKKIQQLKNTAIDEKVDTEEESKLYCKICNKKFFRKDILDRHIKSVHKNSKFKKI